MAEDEWGRALLKVAWFLRECRDGKECEALQWLFSKSLEDQDSILAQAVLGEDLRRWPKGSLSAFAIAKHEESKVAEAGSERVAEADATTVTSGHGQASTVAEATGGQSMAAPLSQKASASAAGAGQSASAAAVGNASKSQSTINVGSGTPLAHGTVAASSS